jgi:cellulose synthase/poly-beta-1,6-N-acetylglucosamine synthase-like glycosyltransferase
VGPLTLLLSLLVVCFEFQNVLARWRGRIVWSPVDACWDFTIVVPLWGDPSYFTHRESLVPYRQRTLVAIEVSNPRMAVFAVQLEIEGWRVVRLHDPRPNPARLIRTALGAVTTPYVLRLDADTQVGALLPQAVAALRDHGADLSSVKVEVANPTTVCARLQALEYRMAMLSRHFRPWLTSGACFLARTDSLRRIFAHHSCWSPGEDIETGRVAHALGLHIRHVDLVVQTEVPETFRELLSQRRLWWAGSFRHTIVNVDRNLVQLPLLTAFQVSAIWVSTTSRWWQHVDQRSIPAHVLIIYGTYLLVTGISNSQVASYWMLLYPLYAAVQSLILPPLGAATYLRLAGREGRLGRYRFPHRRLRAPLRV